MSDAAVPLTGPAAVEPASAGRAAGVAGPGPSPVGAAERPVAVAVGSLERAERTLAAVDRALEALDRGTYGRCTVCDAAIADADLADDPTLATCGEHHDLG